MAKSRENLRLRLVSDSDQKSKPRQGKCFLLNVAQVCLVLLFLMVLTFIALRLVQIEKDITEKDTEKGGTIPGSDFCKSVNAENMSLVALGYLTGLKGGVKTMEAKNQIYYITERMFTDQEACAIEATLRLLQDKSVFVIEIGDFTIENHTEIDYVKFLRDHYTNLNQIKSSPNMFFKGSPFQNHFKNVSDLAILAAKVLLVWQFGGTVLSPNFLLLTRRLFDSNEGFCEVDRELLFCPNQCSAFVYQLVKTILDLIKSSQTWHAMTEQVLEQIVDDTVAAYCGDKAVVAMGCIGVNRIKPYSVCREIHKDCEYLRVQQWKVKDTNWKTVVQKFCPKIVSKYMPNLT